MQHAGPSYFQPKIYCVDDNDSMKEDQAEMKTSRKIKIKFHSIQLSTSWCTLHTTQHFLAVSKDIFGSPCAICNTLVT